jgi:hypothetical protein
LGFDYEVQRRAGWAGGRLRGRGTDSAPEFHF